MRKMNVVLLQSALVAIFVSSVQCLSENDETAILKSMRSIIDKCLEPCGVRDSKVEDEDIDPCLKNCFVKTLDLINDEGQLNQDVLKVMFKDYVENEDEGKQKRKTFEDCYIDQNSGVADDADAESKRMDIVFDCLDSTLDE